jgi:hypothetical protein
LLPGHAITVGDIMKQTAITFPFVTVSEVTGKAINYLVQQSLKWRCAKA